MKILVGLSGGVDSAVAAALLKEQGHEVVAGFMKNYTSESGNCTTYNDVIDAIKVAEFLGIEIRSFDLQKEYQERIIDYIYAGYQKGITPNPDVLCNSLIKFDVFLQKALEQGFDKIATGHYARIEEKSSLVKAKRSEVPSYRESAERSEAEGYHQKLFSEIASLKNSEFSTEGQSSLTKEGLHSSLEAEKTFSLLRGVDHNKDQSYFLAGLNQFQLQHSVFPLWELTKPEVRALAEKMGLPNAKRRDSQGLCFIGNVPIKTFLMQKFPIKKGEIRTLEGQVVGTHDGAYFFTIGQKQGLGLNFKAYVYRIDIENNIVYVCDKEAEELQTQEIIVKDWHWIAKEYPVWSSLTGKIRYRQNPPVPCSLLKKGNSELTFRFDQPQWAVAPGQVFVLYYGEICLWSGIIA